MMDTVTWTAGQLKTVTSYCFSKWLLDSKQQDLWPTSSGPLRQAFGVHPTEASKTGLTHRKCVCRLAREVSKPVVIHCIGTASNAKACLWIMKGNLQNDQMVYCLHFNETEELALELAATFPNVVFVVAPSILKQLHDKQEKLSVYIA